MEFKIPTYLVKGRKHGLNYELMKERIIEQALEIASLQRVRDNLLQQAQRKAQEARTQRNTVYRIYEALGIREGDWHGARPVIALFEKMMEVNEKLAAKPGSEHLVWVTREDIMELSMLHSHGLTAEIAIKDRDIAEHAKQLIKGLTSLSDSDPTGIQLVQSVARLLEKS